MLKKGVFLLVMMPAYLASQNFSALAGGRSQAMAHSSVAISDIWATHHNQAALAFLEEAACAFSLEQRYFLKALKLANASIAVPTKHGAIGIGLTYFGFKYYNNSKVGISYARKFGKYFSMGLQANYHQLHVSEGTTGGGSISFEAGLFARPIRDLSIGFHIFNPTYNYTKPGYMPQLTLIGRLGAFYDLNENTSLSLELKKDQQLTNEQYSLGFEYNVFEALWLRTGIGTFPFRNSLGFGFEFPHFSTDLSFEYGSILGSTSNISFQYQF